MSSASPPGEPTLTALVVDDEVALAEIVASYLKRDMFEVHLAHDGSAALALAQRIAPDVVILDIGLPGVDGIEVCRRLRLFSDAYVVMLTARDTEIDTVIGLSVGADDYVTKPFSPRELTARVQAMLRRPRRPPTTHGAASSPGNARRTFGALEIDVDGRELFLAGTPIMLTRTEFDILATLSAHPNRVRSRHQILADVWGDTWAGADNVVDVHVGHLRRKLGDDPAAPRFILTIRGVGYRMGLG